MKFKVYERGLQLTQINFIETLHTGRLLPHI